MENFIRKCKRIFTNVPSNRILIHYPYRKEKRQFFLCFRARSDLIDIAIAFARQTADFYFSIYEGYLCDTDEKKKQLLFGTECS